MAWLMLALLCFAPAASAQDAAPDAAAVRACLDAAERDPEAERACIGVQALDCVDASPEAQTTAGMIGCFVAEEAAWAAVRDATYGDLVALIRATAPADDPAAAEPQERLLSQAQAAWSAFRDADCAQEAAHWGAGSMRGVAAAQCRLERGAGRTLELMTKRRVFESQ